MVLEEVSGAGELQLTRRADRAPRSRASPSSRLRALWEDHPVERGEDCRHFRIEGHLHGQGRLGHRHHHTRHAVPGDVAHRQRQPAVLERQHVVEAAADLGRGTVGVGDLDSVELRRQLRQDRALDVAGRFVHALTLAIGDGGCVAARRPSEDQFDAAAEVPQRDNNSGTAHEAKASAPCSSPSRDGFAAERNGIAPRATRAVWLATIVVSRSKRRNRKVSAPAQASQNGSDQPNGSTVIGGKEQHRREDRDQQTGSHLSQPPREGREQEEAAEELPESVNAQEEHQRHPWDTRRPPGAELGIRRAPRRRAA